MSSRVTRSAARSAAQRSQAQQLSPNDDDDEEEEINDPAPPQTLRSTKRKARASDTTTTATSPSDSPQASSTGRRSKRQKLQETTKKDKGAIDFTPPVRAGGSGKQLVMSASGPSNGEEEEDINSPSVLSSRKKPIKGKRITQDVTPSTPQPLSRRPKKSSKKSDESVSPEEPSKRSTSKPVVKKGSRESKSRAQAQTLETSEPNPDEDIDMDDDDDDEADPSTDPFSRGAFLNRGGSTSLSQARALLGGLMPHPGTAAKLRGLLQSLRSHDDPGMQILAMEELAELLLVSNEDNLNGQFVPDQFVKELVLIMRGGEFGTSSPEMMELACRCIANLLEALPQVTHSVVSGGAIPVLCEKLTNMEYMEQAEQAMTTLSKISDEFPGAIVREGGLLACLMHLDFFTTYMQKTAVSTAAKCCHDLSESSFDAVLEVMPTLQNVLNNSEQEVVKQAALCITRIVNRFGYHQKIEELVKPELLQVVFRLLLPASSNIVGNDIQTRFLSMLSTVAKASPKLTVELLKNDVVDIIYQFLTGVSPPEGYEDLGTKIDGVLVMQALIHKPRDQIFRALEVICHILPDTANQDSDNRSLPPNLQQTVGMPGHLIRKRSALNVERVKGFETCKDKVRRFVMILLPTLTHAYDITVNLNVRKTVLEAQLKMLSNIDSDILEAALRSVPFASFLASILSQEDHISLVLQALQATELLLARLKSIYAYQFCREGVLAELKRLSEQKLSEKPKSKPDASVTTPQRTPAINHQQMDGSVDDNMDEEDDDDEVHHLDDADVDIEGDGDFAEEYSGSATSSEDEVPTYIYQGENTKDHIILRARKILEAYNDEEGKGIKQQAEEILVKCRSLAKELRECYNQDLHKESLGESEQLFNDLAGYFSSDALKSITSAELLNSDIIDMLLDVLNPEHGASAIHARRAFVEVFMNSVKSTEGSSATPCNVFVHKLQDLLSRKEHLEVVTVHNNSQENTRMDKDNLTYQLGKQIRLKLEGTDAPEIPQRFRNVIVSIHAIAPFKSLNDYLRSRMLVSGDQLSRSEVLSTLAALTGSDMPHRQRLLEMERALQQHRSDTAANSTPTQPNKRSSSKSLREQAATNQAAQATPQTPSPQDKFPTRRSSRHAKSTDTPQTHSTLVNAETEHLQDPLECADEHNLEDDEDEPDMDDEDELDAFVEGLDDELDDEPNVDPGPVNLEVAPTGKVTARQEDGTRIATPSQGTPSVLGSAGVTRRPSGNISSPLSSRSYASVAQSTPQDWHLEFSIDEKPIPLYTTVYRAVHNNNNESADANGRSVWSTTHTIKYKKVLGPIPEPTTLGFPLDGSQAENLPNSLHDNPVTSNILRLLDFLHVMNSNLHDITEDNLKLRLQLHTEPAAQFVNTKLTAKLNRQLEEPLIVASRCLPQWSEDLVRLYPFLFPFEARYLYLQSNYFGYNRAIERWTQAQSDDSRRDRRRDDRSFLSLPKKQKVRIARERLLDSAIKVLELYSSSTASLEVEYFDEVGTGLGPTMEFYSNVSKEFAKKKHNLWRQGESSKDSEYTFSKLGLFPAPMSAAQLGSEEGKKVLSLFKTLGKFVARSMLDSRMIDISLNPLFFRCGNLGKSTISPLATVKLIDQDLANSLKHVQVIVEKNRKTQALRLSGQEKIQATSKINEELEALGLDMTLPGYPEIELIKNGREIDVTAENIEDYLDKVIALTTDQGISSQLKAFQSGFSHVFSYSALNAFTADELVMIFGSNDEDWSITTLIDSVKADHGFNIDSKPVRNLLQVMSELDQTQRRLFLQFVTGSPKLPIGGFKKLLPIFTVVLRKDDSGSAPDEFLPSVMTCTNYLKLPDYSSLEILRMRIHQAINEGQGAFHLS